ncbi:hypothetical protein OF829_18510 [Sphingomonas sp. LB-2]|uniref:hypothetical protein n=1 Tax=Sphingomonas caeni TaxID=2984949 RepID=UPI00222F8D64|nr:hypothetical protein [Sphingomonas caeni]MCW3849235.1 hypothetical protein [Sphingomonas caeni]
MGAIRAYSRAYSNEAAIACTAAFVMLIATAISNYLRLDVDTGGAPFGEYLGQFMLPAIPFGLVLVLLALRSRAAVTVVATLGTLFYLFDWMMLRF